MTFKNRIFRAAKLDANLYDEVEHDENALHQAVGVVTLSGVAAGIGTFSQEGIGGVIVGTVSALVGWYVWAYITFLIGTKLFPEPGTLLSFKEMLRTVGFASSPGLLRVLGIIPGLTTLVFSAAFVWMLIAAVVATRKALHYRSLWRAIAVCTIGWVIQIFLIALFISALGPETRDHTIVI